MTCSQRSEDKRMHAVWGHRHEAENTSNETVQVRDAFVGGDCEESPENYVHSTLDSGCQSPSRSGHCTDSRAVSGSRKTGNNTNVLGRVPACTET